MTKRVVRSRPQRAGRLLVAAFGLLIPCAQAFPRPAQADAPALRLRGRLFVRWGATDERDGWASRFSLARARADARWKVGKRLRLGLEFEASDGFEIRDVYARFQPWRWLRLTAGHFKKPFSRLALDGLGDLAFVERGLLDRFGVRRSRYGGFGARDFGAMVTTRFKGLARLRVDLGAFSGGRVLEGRDEQHDDVVERIQLRPFKGARVAVNACHKRYELAEEARWAHRVGADARWRLGANSLQIEGAYGDNVDAGPGHMLWGVHLMERFEIALPHGLRLEPALMLELFDPDDEVDGGRAYRLAGALNLYYGEALRLSLFGDPHLR
jgi:hypothetical protein